MMAATFGLLFGGLLLAHLLSVAAVAWTCRRRQTMPMLLGSPPKIAIIRPVCGVENLLETTLGSHYGLNYPNLEIIYCAARIDDPAVAIVKSLMAQHPANPGRLLVGEEYVNDNPKLANMAKGYDATDATYVILADSNVLMPPDYVERLLAAWTPDTAVVSSPPVGSQPRGFWAELECAFLNTFQARWQYSASAMGLAFVQGKSMMWRKDILDSLGGVRALGCEIAEDAAATKLTRSAGLKVQLVANPFEQPLGQRSARAIWMRQLRWATLRRATFPLYFTLEALVGSLPPLLIGAIWAKMVGLPIAHVVLGTLVVWYGAEILLAWIVGWYLSWSFVAASMVRDLMLPMLWCRAWGCASIEWRGTEIPVEIDPSVKEIGLGATGA